jgi:hypothetical protein
MPALFTALPADDGRYDSIHVFGGDHLIDNRRIAHPPIAPGADPRQVIGHEAAGRVRRLDHGLRVERLDGVEVDDAGADACGGEAVGGGERFVHGDASRRQRHVVVLGGAHGARAADREPLARRVDDGGGHAQRAQVDDARLVEHLLDEGGGLVGVGGDEHGAVVDGAEHRDVLERHL